MNHSIKFISNYFDQISTISKLINIKEIEDLVHQLKNLKKEMADFFF